MSYRPFKAKVPQKLRKKYIIFSCLVKIKWKFISTGIIFFFHFFSISSSNVVKSDVEELFFLHAQLRLTFASVKSSPFV